MDSKKHIEIVVASRSSIIHHGLEKVIENRQKPVQVFHAESTDKVIELNKIKPSALFIFDFDLDVFNLKFIQKFAKKTNSVIIIDAVDKRLIRSLMDFGIPSILTKNCDDEEIIDSLKAVDAGFRFYCDNVLNALLHNDTQEASCEATSLSTREVEVLELLAQGKTNKEAGEILHLSHHTVHSHRKNIMKKLKVNSVSELVSAAYQLNILQNTLNR